MADLNFGGDGFGELTFNGVINATGVSAVVELDPTSNTWGQNPWGEGPWGDPYDHLLITTIASPDGVQPIVQLSNQTFVFSDVDFTVTGVGLSLNTAYANVWGNIPVPDSANWTDIIV